MKTVYIAHPLRGDVQENIEKITLICKALSEKEEVVPISPIHAFSFMSTDGDQSQVMQYCLNLLSKVDELWVFGKWRESEGCQMEVAYARERSIPIMFVSFVS